MGQHKTMPDFLIIGAMKCGTSTLAAQLGAQDGIFMTTPKEPNFFSDDAQWARGLPWYQGLFAAATPGDLTGEASTHYTKLPTHPRTLERMRPLIAAPRLVCLIRNPLDRLVSHYIHEWTTGVISCGIDEAVDRHPELVDYGCYAMQLAPWVDAYGRDALLVETNPRLDRAGPEVLARVAAHVGHAGPVAWRDLPRENVSAERFRRKPLDKLLIHNPVADFLRRALVPKAIRARIKASRQLQGKPTLSPPVRARLEARFAEDHRALVALLGPDPAIDACYPFLNPAAGAA